MLVVLAGQSDIAASSQHSRSLLCPAIGGWLPGAEARSAGSELPKHHAVWASCLYSAEASRPDGTATTPRPISTMRMLSSFPPKLSGW